MWRVQQIIPIILIAVLSLTASGIMPLSQPIDLVTPDQLLLNGSTHAALTSYRALADIHPTQPNVLLRLGLVYTLRNQPSLAQTALASALGNGSTGSDYDLVRLTQGVLAARHAGYGEPRIFWQMVADTSALVASRETLNADLFLQQEQYAEAEAAYRTALLANPTPVWASHIHTQLALLRASSDPQTAQAELQAAIATATNTQPAQLADLLLPKANRLAERLSATLVDDSQLRAQLLGQLYLEQGLYGLAESQFILVAEDGPYALAAATSRAYGLWLRGDQTGGIAQLRQIVEQHPDQPRARALLALVALSTDDLQSTREQLAIIEKSAPNEAATHLAWGQWYAAQRDYVAAAAAYQRALSRAVVAERETYAVYLARFYLDATFEVCSAGLPAAEAAVSSSSSSVVAYATLAQARLACNDPVGSRNAAERAIEQDPTNPEAYYRLGQALAYLGDREAAQRTLIEAADRDLGGPWQQRAEDQMAVWGMK
jgi:tetratricopeptide (TPR) repeat protein